MTESYLTFNVSQILNGSQAIFYYNITSDEEVSQSDERFIRELGWEIGKYLGEGRMDELLDAGKLTFSQSSSTEIRLTNNANKKFVEIPIDSESMNEKNINEFIEVLDIAEKFKLLQKDIDRMKVVLKKNLNHSEESTKEDYRVLNETIKNLKQRLRDKDLTREDYMNGIEDFKSKFAMNKLSEEDSILKRIDEFNSCYSKSSDSQYKKTMKNVEQQLSDDILMLCSSNPDFKENLKALCEKPELEDTKFFYLSNLIENLDNKSVKNLLKESSKQQTKTEALV